MATLVHDDVIDRPPKPAEEERPSTTSGATTWSVLAGDALLAEALVILVDETTTGEIVRIMSDMIYRSV